MPVRSIGETDTRILHSVLTFIFLWCFEKLEDVKKLINTRHLKKMPYKKKLQHFSLLRLLK